jgi:hypothetical protein
MTTKSTKTTDKNHSILTDYYVKLEEQIQADQFAVQQAESKGMDKSVIAKAKRDNKNTERALMVATDDSIKSTITDALTAAQAKAAAPMSDDAARQLEALSLRDNIGPAEVDALVTAYGNNYQARVTLRDILGSKGLQTTGGELEGYNNALDWLSRWAVAHCWNAAGTSEKDIANLEGDLFLQRALSGSSLNACDAYEEVFATYEG